MNIAALLSFITNPAISSLVVGFLMGIYTRFKVPKNISLLVSLYLVFCIGLKGGLCLGVSHACSSSLIILMVCGLVIGFLQPFIYFFLLRYVAQLDFETHVVVAAQYGSISIVTFVSALSFLQQYAIHYETFMTAVAGMMELPALFSGLFMLKSAHSSGKELVKSLGAITYKIVTSKKISFIFFGFFTGFMLRDYAQHVGIQAFLWPFTAMLVAFMIDIGIKVAQKRHYIYEFTWPLIAFGIYIPIISGSLSIIISWLLATSVGTAVLFAVLIASASYIAVPAVMATQAPNAKEVIYLPLSLCITLPFNLVIGIPLFYFIANYVL